MEVKPGYKQTEVGVIPEEWEVKSIRDFANIKTGPFGTLLKADEYSGSDGVPLISVGEVGAGRFRVTEHTPLVPENVVRRLPQYVLRVGDIVFGRKGAVDRSALVTQAEDGWFLGSDGISIRPTAKCHPPYLAAQFQRYEIQSWLLHNAIGTTMASLNQGILSRVQIPYAPLPEQRAIAAALSDVDGLLGGLDRLIAKKRDLKQAAMQQLLTGQTRLPGFHGEWEVKTLHEVCQKIQDGTHFSPKLGGNDFLYVTSKNIRFGMLDMSTAERISAAEHFKIYARCDVKKGDLLLTKDGANTGNAALNPLDEPFSLLSSVAMLRFDSRYHSAAYFMYQILSDFGQMQIKDAMSGNAITRLTLQKIRALRFSAASLAEQTAIATVLSEMDGELAVLEQRREKTRALKQAMMQELLTGRTRLV